MIMKKLILSFLLALLAPILAEAQEMYAVYDGDKTLTFYYDALKDTRDGTVFGCEVHYMEEAEMYLPGWFAEEGISLKVERVVFHSSFANARPTSLENWFYYFLNLKEIDNIELLNTESVTSMSQMFGGCSGLTSLDVSHFDTRNVTNMYGMFWGCSELTSLDVSHFDTGNVTNMTGMFGFCSALTSLDVSHFDTGNVTNMSIMFYSCIGLTSLDVSHFDTGNVTSMSMMFDSCCALTSLDVSHFDTGNVTNMSGMFMACSALTSLDVSHFDTRNVTDMSQMFEGCTGIKELDLTNFRLRSDAVLNRMFRNCSSLTTIYCNGDWNAYERESAGMFSGCTSLVGGAGTKYEKSVGGTSAYMAHPDSKSNPGYFTQTDTESGYAVWDSSQKILSFYYDSKQDERDGTIYACTPVWNSTLGQYEPEWHAIGGEVTRVFFHPSYAYARPKSLTRWFDGFYTLTAIENLDVLNTSEVTDMSWLFSSCSNLYSLDLMHLDMGKVKNVEYMFYLCSSLTAIYCNDDWSQLTNIENSENMFISCFNLAGDFGTTFADNSWLTGITCARPDGGSYAPGFFSSKESVQKWPEGDLNHDGLVNAADLVRLADMIMNWK